MHGILRLGICFRQGCDMCMVLRLLLLIKVKRLADRERVGTNSSELMNREL